MSTIVRRDFLKMMGMAGVVTVGAGVVPFSLGAQRTAAQGNARLGKIVITETPVARIHTYVAPEESVQVTTHIIETANSLVLVDAQFALPFAQEVREYAESLGKPIDRIILSHDHPDHWSGSPAFDMPLVTTANIAANLQQRIDEGSAQAPEGFIAPEGALEAGTLVIDGLTYDISIYLDAEAAEQLVIRIPEAKTIILQDLLYNAGYFFPGQNRVNWIQVLDELRKAMVTENITTVLVGHGVPTTRGTLDVGIEYLTLLEELFTTAASAEEVVQGIQARYPSYEGAFILTFYALFFQGA